MKKGHKMTKEQREKMSLAKIGALNPRFGKFGTCLGRKQTPEQIEKIKAARAKQIITSDHKRKISEGLKRAYTEGRRKMKEKTEKVFKIRVAWNKGKKCPGLGGRPKGIPAWNKGIKHSPELVKKMRLTRLGKKKGEENTKWLGEKVKYCGLHQWISRELGTPNKCEHCGSVGYGRQMHWANKDHKYKRNLVDWLRLCVTCHRKYDRNLRSEIRHASALDI